VQYRGFLYTKNERVVVLLNNLVEGADLDPLYNIRYKYVEPEADMIIIPIHQVNEIAIDTWRKCIYQIFDSRVSVDNTRPCLFFQITKSNRLQGINTKHS